MEIPVRTYLIFKITSIRLFHPLRQVAEEDKCRDTRSFEHRDVLYLYVLSLVGWRRICGNVLLKHSVKLMSRHLATTVLINIDIRLKHFVDSLLGKGRTENNRKIHKGSELVSYRILKMLDGNL